MTTQNNARGRNNGKGSNFKGKRGPRRMSPSLEEAVKLAKSLRGRGKVYGMMSTNERGDVTEVGVYNGNTKKYAIYRTDLVDNEVVAEFKEIAGQSQ